jgi:cytochrome P450
VTTVEAPVPDLFDPANLADPYPAYAELRAAGPVYDEANGCWLIARHADVLAVLHQPSAFSSQGGYRSLMGGEIGPADRRGRGSAVGLDQAIGARVLIASDPPTHTDLRRMVSRPFTRRAIESWAPRVAALADELVGAFVAKAADGAVDLVDELAVPLPVTVIAEILGIPVERRDDFRRWSDALVGSLGADADLDIARSEIAEMVTFFIEVTEQRRSDPGDDLISAIAGPDDDGDHLEPFEVVMFCVLLLVAGNETTTNLLGNLVEALWDHPDQAQLLNDDPTAIRAAVEEGLRYCGPIQGLARRTTSPVVVGDVEIPADHDVLVLFAAANRDGAVFDDAERFDLWRDTRDQVALGHGIHYCLGAHLARTETAEALRALRDRGVRLEPEGAPVRTGSAILRGFSSLPVSVTATSR